MYIYTMKCVGYDNDFQRALSEQFYPGWKPPPKLPKILARSASGTTGKTKSSDRHPPDGKKRMHKDLSEGISDCESEPGNSDREYSDLSTIRSRKRRCKATP